MASYALPLLALLLLAPALVVGVRPTTPGLNNCNYGDLVCWGVSQFSCGTGGRTGGSGYGFEDESHKNKCGMGKLWQYECDPLKGQDFVCDQVCGKTVVVNKIGEWAVVNETLATINMHHPLWLTYQQLPDVPYVTIEILPITHPNLTAPHFRVLPGFNKTIQFDYTWYSKQDGSKKHLLAMGFYAITGQCFTDIWDDQYLGGDLLGIGPYVGPGGLGMSWEKKYIAGAVEDALSGYHFQNVMNNVYTGFFVIVDEQYSAQDCFNVSWNRKVIGPVPPVNVQFLTFKPTSIKVYFSGGPVFAGVTFSRSDNFFKVPYWWSPSGTNYWEMTMAENEYISQVRFNRDTDIRDVTCVGFGVTDLDGNTRSVGGCTQEVYDNPYSFSFKGTGTWVFTVKC